MAKIKTSTSLNIDIDSTNALAIYSDRMFFDTNLNFASSGYNSSSAGSIRIINDPNTYRVNTSLTSFTNQIGAYSKDVIFNFADVVSGEILTIHGFKCDYSLSCYNSPNYTTRVGTLLCAFNNDVGNTMSINVVDSHIVGDDTLSLSKAKFTAEWNSNSVDLKLDALDIGVAVTFAGSFTIFTNNN